MSSMWIIKQVHTKIKLSKNVVKPFACEECLYATSNKGHLNQHIKHVHFGVKDNSWFRFPGLKWKKLFSNHIKSVHDRHNPHKTKED